MQPESPSNASGHASGHAGIREVYELGERIRADVDRTRNEVLLALNGLRSEVMTQQDEIFERLRKVERWQAIEEAKRTWPRAVGRWAATLGTGVLLAVVNMLTR